MSWTFHTADQPEPQASRPPRNEHPRSVISPVLGQRATQIRQIDQAHDCR